MESSIRQDIFAAMTSIPFENILSIEFSSIFAHCELRKNPAGGLPKQTLESDFTILSPPVTSETPLPFALFDETEVVKISIEVLEEIMKNKASSVIIRVCWVAMLM